MIINNNKSMILNVMTSFFCFHFFFSLSIESKHLTWSPRPCRLGHFQPLALFPHYNTAFSVLHKQTMWFPTQGLVPCPLLFFPQCVSLLPPSLLCHLQGETVQKTQMLYPNHSALSLYNHYHKLVLSCLTDCHCTSGM